MRIGFTSTSFRQIRNLEKIVKIARESGVDCIEWGGDVHVKDVAAAKRAKKLCDDAGVAISSYGSYYRVGRCNAVEWKNVHICAKHALFVEKLFYKCSLTVNLCKWNFISPVEFVGYNPVFAISFFII